MSNEVELSALQALAYGGQMAHESIKTIRGRQYRYLSESHRVGGKVKTTTKYLGPVVPRRKKGQGGFLAFGVASLLIHAAKKTLGPPGGNAYNDKHPPPDPRTQVHQHNHFVDLAERDPRAAIADIQARARVSGTRAAPPAPMSADMKAFSDRLASAQEIDGGRVLDAAPAPSAPDQPDQAVPDAPEEGDSSSS